MQIPAPRIEATAAAAAAPYGAGEWQAAEVARAVARAEATATVICGLYHLEGYCVQLASGRVDGRVEPVIHAPCPAAAAADACFDFAQPAFARAREGAI